MTDIPLRDYVDHAIVALDRRVNDRFEAGRRELEHTAIQLDKRLETMNEFRGSLRDAQNNFTTRREHELVVEQVTSLGNRLANLDGKLVIIPSIVSLAIGVLILLIAKFIR